MSGLNGLLTIFKREVENDSKITFIGSPGLCTPFAEFMSFGVADKETHFIPLLDLDDCHEFELQSYGMSLANDVSNPHDSDVIVILGGLSIPDYNVDVKDLNNLIDDILKDDGKIIGVCFMNMFSDTGWVNEIDFDCIIDGTLIPMIKR
ncbi:MAG: DUF2124 family protein [Methanobrevibacter sp.]|nr:DUF2124 family protein [Methanobrevibacter sp.]